MPPRPPRRSTSAATAAAWAARSGPGSTTQAGSRPRIHVFVPSSVKGPGLSARTRPTSWGARTGSAIARTLPGGNDPVHRAGARDDVHAAEHVLAERGELGRAQARGPALGGAARGQARRQDAAVAVVAVQVAALPARQARVADHEAAGDGAAGARRVRDLGEQQARRALARVAPSPLPHPPAEVAPAGAAAGNERDLLEAALAHV